MVKKIVIVFLVLGIAGGGFFYWWQNQADVRELNKTLPEGVGVTKSLFGEEYRVVNKIDGYSFKVPAAWKGVKEMEYISEREEMGYIGISLSLEGNEGAGRIASIDQFKSGGGDPNISLRLWAETEFEVFGLVGDFTDDEIDGLKVVKTQENIHFGGDYVYFFENEKGNIIYSITGGSEEFIKEIILNGAW